MSRTKNELLVRSKTFRKSFKPMPRIQYAVLGDGAGNVAVDGRPGYVHVRIGGETGRLTIAVNKRAPNINNFPVSVGYEDTGGRILHVLGVNDRVFPADSPWDGQGTVGQHANQHMLPDGADIVWVNKKQILPLMVRPTNPTSTLVEIYPDYYHSGSSWNYFEGSTIDLASHAPAAYPYARYVLLSFNLEDGTVSTTDGPQFPLYVQADLIPYIPSPPEGEYPLAAVVMTYQADPVVYRDIYDVRLLFTPVGTRDEISYWNLFK